MAATAHSDALLLGLNALRLSDKLFDVSLIVEGRTFKAHRVVLAACSEYFCAMFSDFGEARKPEIELKGVNARGMELLIEYAYTANLKLDKSNVQDVLEVASHIQMTAAINLCTKFLESHIDLDNCVGIATLADVYALKNLKRKTYRYLSSKLEKLSKLPDFMLLSWEQLQQILMSNNTVDCREERVMQIIMEYCITKSIKPEIARQLFAQVRFNQFDKPFASDMCDIKSADPEHYERLCSELLCVQLQQSAQERLRDPTEIAAETALKVLTNSRGMELALVRIGGFETDGLTNEISCFLPSKKKWEELTVIPHINQCNYGTAVLGNKLYIVGGTYDINLKEALHPFGFGYCPLKNKWRSIAPIQSDRCRFSLNAMGDKYLYAVGGIDELSECNNDIDYFTYEVGITNFERYDASIDRWEYLPALPERRFQHAGVVVDDQLYISGGLDRQFVLASFWCFDTKSNQWSNLNPMLTPRADHVLFAHEGYIYACGGWYEDPTSEMRKLAKTIDVYDIKTGQWTTETLNPKPKYYTGVAVLKRKVYFIGGLLSKAALNRATLAVQCYDLDTKQWSVNDEWEQPHEVWECSCVTLYVPCERDV